MTVRSWWFSILRMAQVGIQVLLKVSQFANRQNKCIQNSRITELLRLEGTSREHLVFGESYVLFMEKERLFSFVLETTTKSKPIGNRGIHSSFIIAIFQQQIYSPTLWISRNARKIVHRK